jgi:hypothetical protein
MGIAGNLYVLVSGRCNDTHTQDTFPAHRRCGVAAFDPFVRNRSGEAQSRRYHRTWRTSVGRQDWIQDVISLHGRSTVIHFPEAIDSTISVPHQSPPPKSRCPGNQSSGISAAARGIAHRPVRLTLGPAGWCRETYPSAWSLPQL